MKRIFYTEITGPDYARSMGEIMEANYSVEWSGDVAGYLENLDPTPAYKEGAEYIPGDVMQNFGGYDPENICVVFSGDQAIEVWFSADAD